MSRKGEYSDKYGFHISKLIFDCGGQSMSSAVHGTLSTLDIDGAQPRRCTVERQMPGPLQIHELSIIEQGSAGVSKRKLPGAPRNPLDPQYHLPEEHPPPPVEHLKFIRDTLNVSDIDGAQKQASKRKLVKPPATMDNSDIEGSRHQETRENKQIRTAHLDVSDINNGEKEIVKGSSSVVKSAQVVSDIDIDARFVGKAKTCQG